MHGKYAVIALLLAGLAVLIIGLTRLEQRRARPAVVAAAQPPPPPFEITASREELGAAAAQAKLLFRCAGDEFEHLAVSSSMRGEKTESWHKLFVAGANLGVALPGHYPTEFGATLEDYSRWLGQMGDAELNVVRTYTILPPEFYQALAQHNFSRSDRPVYLVQGIWAEPPASGNLFDKGYSDSIKREVCSAVDVVAGRAVLPERAGHASGAYSTDVSTYTLGFLFGREWESEVVRHTDTMNQAISRYQGTFVNVPSGSPTEAWLAGILDYLSSYEVLTCSTLHPVAFVTWLPLDPMHHSSEYPSRGGAGEHDNDLVVLDPMRLHTTPAMRAGIYAAYHVYPYYPDYIFLEPYYRDYLNRHGQPDNYAGYLHNLKRHHAGMPLLVAEYGVPSSRGNSHHNGLGMDHGSHNEEEQAQLNLKMLTAIYDEGLAGGIAFAWLDEWFKRNWLIDDIAVPRDRVRTWHNVQNPEQCYGVVKFGRELVALDGATADWPGKPLARGEQAIRSLWAHADEEYLYLRLDLEEQPDWPRRRIGIAIDTYDPRLGNTRLGPVGLDCANGSEFLVLLDDTAHAEVLVDSAYSVFSDPRSPVQPRYRTLPRSDGSFITQRLMNNHPRFTAAGDTVPAQVTEYGRLRYGRSEENSLADWYAQGGVIELRLPWGILNVSDPSTFQVIQNDTLTPGIETATTNGFAFSAFIMRDDAAGADGLVAALPAAKAGRLSFTSRWRWPGWDMPAYTERLKKGYEVIGAGLAGIAADSALRRASLDRIAGEPARTITARIAPFAGDAPLAASFTFDDGSYDLYTSALPFLSAYGFKANFGLVSDWTGPQADWHAEKNGTTFKRMGVPEAKALLARGHRVSVHGSNHEPEAVQGNAARILDEVRSSKAALEAALGVSVQTYHYPYSIIRPANIEAVRRAGFWFGRTSDDRHNLPAGFDRFRVSSFAFYNDTSPNLKELARIIDRGRWTVLLNHHVLDSTAPELLTMARHNVLHTYSVTPLSFGRQVRLVRNSGAWVAPLEDVGRYLLQFRKARLDVRRSERSVTLRLDNARFGDMEPMPMTVVLSLPWRWVAVSGSSTDGIYSPYAGRLLLDLLPGEEATITRLIETP